MSVIAGILDILIPKSCFCCGKKSTTPICSGCESSFKYIDKAFCQRCAHPTLFSVNVCRQCRGKHLYFCQARSLLLYEGNAKIALWALKSEGSYALADFFIRQALERIEKSFFLVDAITFIPSTFYKRLSRGHNSAALLARCLAYHLKVPLIETLVLKKKVKDQVKLTIDERKANLKEAFRVKNKIKGKESVLVVDDIFTTGATFNEASRVLTGKNINLKVFSVARTLSS